jgi:tRNA threonylcarbamoyl adenosine modification protein (Sua5/YciO/YrdC/YwlC family)
MATTYYLHPENPQRRTIEEICQALENGAIMLYPTDTVHAIGCDLKVRPAVERVRQIKRQSNDKPLTFLCSSLSDISDHAVVTDRSYKIMKRLIPGPYTFLLPATKLVPKLVMDPKRKTTGIRVPDHPICRALLETLENPIVSTSAHLPDDGGDFPTLGLESARLFDALANVVDIIVDDGSVPGVEVSTILDLTGDEPAIAREGALREELRAWLL